MSLLSFPFAPSASCFVEHQAGKRKKRKQGKSIVINHCTYRLSQFCTSLKGWMKVIINLLFSIYLYLFLIFSFKGKQRLKLKIPSYTYLITILRSLQPSKHIWRIQTSLCITSLPWFLEIKIISLNLTLNLKK